MTTRKPFGGASQIRVLVVSEIRVVRDAISRSLRQSSGYSVIPVAPPAIRNSSFDVAVVEQSDFCRAADSLRDLVGLTPIIVIGIPLGDSDLILECARLGGRGFLELEATHSELTNAIETVLRGGIVCPAGLSEAIVRRAADRSKVRQDTVQLTSREKLIANLLREGLSNGEIATRLSIKRATVKNHVHTILLKLNIRRRTDVGASEDARISIATAVENSVGV